MPYNDFYLFCGYVHFCDSYIFVIAEIYLVFSLTGVLWQFQQYIMLMIQDSNFGPFPSSNYLLSAKNLYLKSCNLKITSLIKNPLTITDLLIHILYNIPLFHIVTTSRNIDAALAAPAKALNHYEIPRIVWVQKDLLNKDLNFQSLLVIFNLFLLKSANIFKYRFHLR